MKKKILIIAAIVLPIITLLVMWAVNNHNNEKIYNKELAAFYDETMQTTYPFYEHVSGLLTFILDDMETVANQTNMYYSYSFEYSFEQISNKQSQIRTLAEFYLYSVRVFLSSEVCLTLSNGGGTLRQNEASGFSKFRDVWIKVDNRIDYSDYDTLIQTISLCKQELKDAAFELSKYKTNNSDLYAWRSIDFKKKYSIHERYKKNKNWPFAFLNKDR